MGRYMERAENLARILDVNETFARDSSEEEVWLPILRLHSEEETFLKKYDKATAREVVYFYTLERNAPNSIRTCLDNARENARTMRHLISTEMWRQLNIFSHLAVRPDPARYPPGSAFRCVRRDQGKLSDTHRSPGGHAAP